MTRRPDALDFSEIGKIVYAHVEESVEDSFFDEELPLPDLNDIEDPREFGENFVNKLARRGWRLVREEAP